jgi:hypothetical protein
MSSSDLAKLERKSCRTEYGQLQAELAALYVTHQTDFAGGLPASSFRFGAVTIEPEG